MKYSTSSTLVPFNLKTIGFFIPSVVSPLISPKTITSHLAIPANMFTKIASTFGSLSIIFNAATIS